MKKVIVRWMNEYVTEGKEEEEGGERGEWC